MPSWISYFTKLCHRLKCNYGLAWIGTVEREHTTTVALFHGRPQISITMAATAYAERGHKLHSTRIAHAEDIECAYLDRADIGTGVALGIGGDTGQVNACRRDRQTDRKSVG